MKKIIFFAMVTAAWVLGISEGDCTAAVMFSLFGALALIQGSQNAPTECTFGEEEKPSVKRRCAACRASSQKDEL